MAHASMHAKYWGWPRIGVVSKQGKESNMRGSGIPRGPGTCQPETHPRPDP
jgi:hypothetical protein